MTQQKGGPGRGFGTMGSGGQQTRAARTVTTGKKAKKNRGKAGTNAGSKVAGKRSSGTVTGNRQGSIVPKNNHY